MAVVLLGEAVQHGISEAFTTAMVSVAVIGLLVPDLHALGWVALWKGLTSHTAREASQGAVGAVVVLPAALAGVLSIGVGLMDWPIPPMVVFVAAWIGLGLLIGWRMAEYARRQLHLGLADWALRRSSGDPMQYVGWQKWGRRLGRWWGTPRRRFRMDSPRR